MRNYPIAMGMIYVVTGVKTFPVFSRKQYCPVRGGIHECCQWQTAGLRILELDRCPELDLTFVNSADIHQGGEHSDVLVVSCGGKWFPGVVDVYRKSQMDDFMDRGSRFFAGGNEKIRHLLKHKNFVVLPERQSFEAEILKNL